MLSPRLYLILKSQIVRSGAFSRQTKCSRLESSWRRTFASEPIAEPAATGPVSVTGTDNEATSASLTKSGKPRHNIPFAKDLFLGKFDKNMLVFPEVLSKEEVDDLNHMVQPVEKFFFEDLDSASIDKQGSIPKEVLEILGHLGLFGQQIPVEYGGLGLNATQYTRLAEFTAHDGGIAVTLGAHQSIGLKGILLFGTEEQKAKYLPKLATGEHIAAFCLTEPTSGSDAASIQTRATLSEDGKTYLLNGGKIWISNGGIAEIMTVFARTEVKDDQGEFQDKITAFIVERSFGGVTSGNPENKLGIRGSNTTEVFFDNAPVPAENVLDKPGRGFKVAVNILNSGRFSMGSSGAGNLKTSLRLLSEHACTRTQFGKKLMEFGLIQEKFAKITLAAYAMESMAYMASGILDSHEEADASVEAAMVKVFSSDNLWECASEALQIMGGQGYMSALPYERALRDARILMIFEGTNEILRLYIALTCLQHAGAELRADLKKLKNPLNNMGFVFKKAVERVQTKRENPKLSQQLSLEVHPNLASAADALEKNLVKFRFVVEQYLAKYTSEIIHEQMALKRMADIGIDMFAMTAVLARASRSISIGLKSHDHEILLARAFCFEASNRIDKNLSELNADKHNNGDEYRRLIAEDIFKAGSYVAEHPLTRNW